MGHDNARDHHAVYARVRESETRFPGTEPFRFAVISDNYLNPLAPVTGSRTITSDQTVYSNSSSF